MVAHPNDFPDIRGETGLTFTEAPSRPLRGEVMRVKAIALALMTPLISLAEPADKTAECLMGPFALWPARTSHV